MSIYEGVRSTRIIGHWNRRRWVSGGPAFWTKSDGSRTLVGVTSGGDAKCTGTGLYARTDPKRVLDFIDDNLPK